MAHFQELVGATVVIIGTYFLWDWWSEYVRFQRFARLYGCKPAPRYPNKEPFLGYDLFRRLKAADAAGQRSEAYQDLRRRYGATFEMKALSAPSVQTAHPENVQAVCTSKFESFGVEPMRGRVGAPFMDRGIFLVDGEYWRHSRDLIRPIFSRAEIADLDHFESHVVRLLKLIPADGESFDLLPLVKRLFVDTATEFIFGRSVGSLLPDPSSEMIEFMRAFDRSLLGLALTLILGPFKFPIYIDPGWIKAYKKVHAFIDARIEDALKTREDEQLTGPSTTEGKARPPGEKSRPKYVLINEIARYTQDRYELRHQAINIFFPARDTTAIAFGNIFFYLSRYPEWFTRLREEVVPLRNTHVTFETVRSLKTVKAIVNEAIRLHPAVSRLGRVALADTVLPKGGGPDGESPMFVPKGRVLEMDVYTIQHDPKYWGPEADEFKPERWKEGRPLWESKWQYEPFLGGLRMCPAQNQVLTQLAYLLVRFGQEFERVECRDPEPGYFEQIAMTVESKNGAKIALWRDPEATTV